MVNGIRSSGMKSGAYLLADGGLICGFGEAFTEMTGYTKSDIDQKGISIVLKALLGSSFDLSALEQEGSMNAFLLTKYSEAIEVTIFYLLLESGQKVYSIRRKLNYMLDADKSFVENLMEENDICIGLYSCPDFRLLKGSKKFLAFIDEKYHKTDVLGLCMKEIAPDYNGSNLERQWKIMSETGAIQRWEEIKTTTPYGDHYWNCIFTPVYDEGIVRYILCMMNEVTDHVVKRMEIEEKNDELSKMIEMKDEFLLLMSHELKTPLSVITSSIQALEIMCKNDLTDKVTKYINKIRQNTYQQLKLVNNILDNTRVNSGYFRLNKKDVDLVQITRMITESISVFAERKRIRLTFSSAMEQAIMELDVEIYERILLNLLSNAVKYTPEGKTIEVRVFQVDLKGRENICIQVKDSGIGIPSDKKDYIFERFGRGEKMLGKYTESTGIGLYLVKMLVSLMEGEIKLDSMVGVGSTFSLLFPTTNIRTLAQQTYVMEKPSEQLINATVIEFSDIYYGA
ncbi:PAS domain-containing protein [Anoxybacterium hadale]|uniref:PAS domain-containing protein n=1 Tax=Anoxybacterium hadale TaxID=3408580 RepID=A0ACD1AAF6_9FIRM|nr:PAS domain-containing protein [Clostridiales bacterium]